MKEENIRLIEDDILKRIELLEKQCEESNNDMQILLRKVEIIEEYFSKINNI